VLDGSGRYGRDQHLWSPSIRRAAPEHSTAVREALDGDALAARRPATYDQAHGG